MAVMDLVSNASSPGFANNTLSGHVACIPDSWVVANHDSISQQQSPLATLFALIRSFDEDRLAFVPRYAALLRNWFFGWNFSSIANDNKQNQLKKFECRESGSCVIRENLTPNNKFIVKIEQGSPSFGWYSVPKHQMWIPGSAPFPFGIPIKEGPSQYKPEALLLMHSYRAKSPKWRVIVEYVNCILTDAVDLHARIKACQPPISTSRNPTPAHYYCSSQHYSVWMPHSVSRS